MTSVNRRLIILFISTWLYSPLFAQIDKENVSQDLTKLLNDIRYNYVYLEEKNIDPDCLEGYYTSQIDALQSNVDVLLLYEYLLNEFYDGHVTLTANTNESYRLFAPIYISIIDDKPIVTSVWQTQINNLDLDLVGAQLIAFNDKEINTSVENFPTHCHDKNDPKVREWILNKIISGRYDEPRILTFKLTSGDETTIDLDELQFIESNTLLSSKEIDGIGYIRINNSLGNDNLVTAFDEALEKFQATKGLILDLRNTVTGGDSYEARGIMSRFIDKPMPYQKHAYMATSQGNPNVERSWVEYVSPRGVQYTKPVVILVGRWTGSMGEGLAIGFEGIGRGEVVGCEMRRLAGEVNDFRFNHVNYGYKLTVAKLFHVDGKIRESYVPANYVKQTTTTKDEVLEYGIELLKQMKD